MREEVSQKVSRNTPAVATPATSPIGDSGIYPERVKTAREKVKGERGIYRRETRTGEARFEVAYLDSDAKQRWKTTSTLREAKALRADLVSKVNRGERVAPSKLTVAAYSAEWLATQEGRLRPRTIALYETQLRVHVIPRLGRRRLADVTVDDVARLVADLQREGYAGWTIRSVLTVLGRVLGNAERRGLIAVNPVGKLERGERPRVGRRELPSLDLEAVGRLIASAPAKYRTLIATSVLLGLRQGEALALRWRDVDVKGGSCTSAGSLTARVRSSR